MGPGRSSVACTSPGNGTWPLAAQLRWITLGSEGVAVESKFNWYWLVDGMLANGYHAMLVNTSAIQRYEGLKHSDDK